MMSMSGRVERDGQPSDSLPAEDLQRQVRAVLEHAVDAHRKNIKVYESLRNLNEVVGTEYGDRVLYELIQNAHDAHRSGDRGRIAVSLTIRSESEGTLYVANGGGGFRWKDVDAIMNLATTAKEIGESIGNKGLGFRSVEVLTDDVPNLLSERQRRFKALRRAIACGSPSGARSRSWFTLMAWIRLPPASLPERCRVISYPSRLPSSPMR